MKCKLIYPNYVKEIKKIKRYLLFNCNKHSISIKYLNRMHCKGWMISCKGSYSWNKQQTIMFGTELKIYSQLSKKLINYNNLVYNSDLIFKTGDKLLTKKFNFMVNVKIVIKNCKNSFKRKIYNFHK